MDLSGLLLSLNKKLLSSRSVSSRFIKKITGFITTKHSMVVSCAKLRSPTLNMMLDMFLTYPSLILKQSFKLRDNLCHQPFHNNSKKFPAFTLGGVAFEVPFPLLLLLCFPRRALCADSAFNLTIDHSKFE
ncbi:hypothetical protein K1719_037883 [Acacia pycnantha]|nr:hypothetical protein K1719_037883 [Acacia pycnantha]